MKNDESKRFGERRSSDVDDSGFARELFTEPLARIGLVPAPSCERGLGVMFTGDGQGSEGSYFAWSFDRSCVVASCDFTMLESRVFSFDFLRYFAVRREVSGLLPPSEVKAFLETNPRPAAVMLPKGCRCAYVEVEYYDDYSEKRLGAPLPEALGPVATLLQNMNERDAWKPDIIRILSMLQSTDAHGIAADLLFRGAVDELMGCILQMEHERDQAGSRADRQAIAAVAAYIRAHVQGPIHQDDLLVLASMGATKFKRLFKAMTGMTATDYIIGVRIERARELLLDADLSIDEVARRCGYATPTSFATVFRRRTGLTPRDWRRRARVSFSADPQAVVEGRLLPL